MLASALLFTALEASGQPNAPMRVQLAFKAPAACADSAEFELRVRQRSDRIAFVTEAPYTGMAKVTLEPAGGTVRVRLGWSRDGGTTIGREFSAASCSEALDAAALVIAISFDPSAPEVPPENGTSTPAETTSERPEGEDPGAGPATSEAQEPEPAGSSEAAAPPDSPSSEPPASDARARAGRAATPPTSESSVVFGSSALVQGVSGVAPTVMAGVGLNLEVAAGQGLFAPQLRLRGVHYFGVTYPTDGGDARFEFDTLELFACPLRLGSPDVSLRPCATFTGGRLIASGRETTNPNTHTRALWILGGALSLAVRPTSFMLLSADLSAGAPTTRDSFQFAPDEFHQISSIVLGASLGLGVEFR
ncbi:MAG TPA: hypothetical protein VFU02_22055 [Polyangiaceae bacterium]|nr:hypothetical protein [Polyangiaceae bacterium]